MSLNLRDVDAMVVRKYSPAKTFGFVAAMTGITGLVVTAAIVAGSEKPCVIGPRYLQCIPPECKYSCPVVGDP